VLDEVAGGFTAVMASIQNVVLAGPSGGTDGDLETIIHSDGATSASD